jgi:DNA-binding Lrp family transcriptional regulator
MLDDKDFKILEVLKENSKLSTQQISKKTLIPITTIHHRIKKLEKQGIIKGYTVLLDNKKLDKGLSAYILITVDYNILKQKKTTQHDLAKKLINLKQVEKSEVVAGGTDIIIKVRVKDIDEMDNFVTKDIRNIEGIEKTQTMIVLHEF